MPANTIKANSVQIIAISNAQAGQRIDNLLLSLAKGVPKSRIYKAIRKGEVRVNKSRTNPTYKVQAGDSVRIPPLRLAAPTKTTFVGEQLTQQLAKAVLWEDNDLLVLNKPSGLAVHAGTNIEQGIIEALRIIHPDQPYLELVHRLDRDTSGILLIAKNRTALLALQQQMSEHSIDKHYLTLVKGNWGNNKKWVEQPLVSNTLSSRERMVQIDPKGKYAKTLFIPLENFGQAQLTQVKLFTGRTHQIRAHALHIAHPIAGDNKYGQREFNKTMKQIGLNRLFLHAWKLIITHPTTQQKQLLQAPLPTPLQNIITKLRDTK